VCLLSPGSVTCHLGQVGGRPATYVPFGPTLGPHVLIFSLYYPAVTTHPKLVELINY
jgi:hypothetical protein